MKKLLTLLSAATVAIGLYAYDDTGTSFEDLSCQVGGTIDITTTTDDLGTNASGFWKTNGSANVSLSIREGVSVSHVNGAYNYPQQFNRDGDPLQNTKYLHVETTFGNPVERFLQTNELGVAINDGLYFDSMVKFTVFEESPTNTPSINFNDAKIAIWVQEDEDVANNATVTNLYIRAGLVGGDPVNYNCGEFSNDDPEAWHRLTIKAINDVYDGDGEGGEMLACFAVFVDGAPCGSSDYTSAQKGLPDLAGSKYSKFYTTANLYPSMVQTSSARALVSVSFDGQGDVDDIVFTATVPFTNAADGEAAYATFGTTPCADITELQTAVNGASAADLLAKTVKFYTDEADNDIAFANNNGTITIDLNGHTIISLTSQTPVCISQDGTISILTIGNNSVINAGTYGDGDDTINIGADTLITGGKFRKDSISQAVIAGLTFESGKGFVTDPTDSNYWTVGDATYSVTLAWPSGLTAVSYAINGGTPVSLTGETTGFAITGLSNGDVISFVVQNADGAKKTLTATAGTDTEIDAESATFTWADYLGETVDGAYVINDAAELLLFKKGVAKFGTSGLTFKLGANIDASSLGYWVGIGAQGTANTGLSNATFDGAGYTISNLSFDNADGAPKYRGFFDRADGSVIKDLTINVVGFKDTNLGEHGYAAFVGNMDNTTLLRCTATGTLGTTAKPTMHTTAGFAVKVASSGTFVDCTNYVNIVCSLDDNPKVGGIVGLVNGGSATVSNCWNFGSLTATPAGVENAANGVGGLVGYSQGNLTIYGGGNEGTVAWTKTTTAHSNNNAINVGTIIGMETGSGKSAMVSGGVVAQANAIPVGSGFAQVTGLNFATVDGNVATFVADNALAAGNTYKVMNTAATATYQFTATGTIAFDTALATPTYAITAASGLAADSYTAGNVKTYYAIDWAPAPAAHAWYESPKAVVLAENLPGQTGNIVSAFHGQGESEYLGMTYSTNPLQFDLFTVDGTNAVDKITSITAEQQPEAGLRGVAISKILGIALTCTYYKYGDAKDGVIYIYTNNLAVALSGSGAPVVVSKDANVAFDAAAFSPDGKYLFSNAVTGESSNQYYVKWAVSDGGATLTRVGSINAGGRARSLAYGRINGRDLVFGLIDAGKVAVIDMTGDDSSAWTATDLITDLPKHSYGTLCVSGVKVTGGTPHLTVATSFNDGATKADVLNVYALSVPATGTVTASLTKSFDEDALTAAGFGDISDANRYGNTVYVTEDEATIYFARPDNKLYAAQYAPSYTITFISGEGSTTNELTVLEGDAVTAPTAAEVTGKTFSAWTPAVVTPAAGDATYTATYTANSYNITYMDGETVLDLAPASYTYGTGVAELPTTSKEDYTFNGWYLEAGFVTKVTSIANNATGAMTLYAKFTQNTPAFDPSSNATNVVVTAASESDAIAAAKNEITVPAGSGAVASEYAELFNYSATAGAGGTYTVTITGLKDTVEDGVEVSAVAALTDSTVDTVSVPKGLYYKITPSADLSNWGTPVGDGQTPSTGSVSAPAIPGEDTSKGFYKIQIDYKPIQ